MRVRITWHITARDRGEERISAEELRQEAKRLMEILISSEEAGQIKNAAVETDAKDPSITVEAIVPSADTSIAIDQLRKIGLASIRRRARNSGPFSRSLEPTEVQSSADPIE